MSEWMPLQVILKNFRMFNGIEYNAYILISSTGYYYQEHVPGMQLSLISKQTETNLNQQTLSHKPGS